MSEEIAALPSSTFLILAFLAGSIFSVIMIFFITWISDRMKESDAALQNIREHNPISDMDTEKLLTDLRELRKDDELARAKKESKEGEQSDAY